MNEYIERINSLSTPTFPTFQQIREIAKETCGRVCNGINNCKPWAVLNHGVDLLDTHEKLCKYLCAYGNMHEEKMKHAFETIANPQNIFNQDITIIDWGCGQGLATVCFFDYLKQTNIQNNTQKVILVEPSEMALGRAKLHVNTYLKDDNKIQTVNKYLDSVTNEDIKIETPVVLHFFSNILDIKNIDLKQLAQKVGQEQTYEQYCICVGPLNSGNQRIEAFYNYFNKPERIANEEINKLPETRNTLKLLVFKLDAGKTNLIKVEYYPSVQFHAAYQLDCVKAAIKDSELKDKITALYNSIVDFEVAAPFDIGASIYDDVHPILAVLNNIVTRGLPTRTSPFIENVFVEKYGNQQQKDDLGNIKYSSNVDIKNLFLSLHLIDSRLELNTDNYNINPLDSDLEKTYITRVAHNFYRQILLPQRSLSSITKNNRAHHSQRVDFACEFPYTDNNIRGCVVELDGEQYHRDSNADMRRDNDLALCQWKCLRIQGSQIDSKISYDNTLNNEYTRNLDKAYQKKFDNEWIETLQLSLTPIAVARVQKTILEALMTNKINIEQKEWNVLVTERDVPCAAIAFEDMKLMFYHLTKLSKDYAGMKFPKINLEIISTKEFANSLLHLDIKPSTDVTNNMRFYEYDMVIDIAMLRRSEIENITFSEFKCKNDCYFNIRSAHFHSSDRHIYTSDTVDYCPLVTKDMQGNYKDIAETKTHLQYFLQLLFRKEDFRPGQLPILDRALQNKSVIGLLPTGGGKSLTYQLAAMLQPGVTLVIDPLRSLMKDQYDGLINAGIDTCTFINSTLDAREKELREKQMESSQMQFVFLSPERLCIYKFRERLKTMRDLHVYFCLRCN
ncbi:MAG: DEAD/DEAH box helicase [Bacteroidales bacterium]|nr:DEAD/DEAH box helicase [Bacteroidales bacterium]